MGMSWIVAAEDPRALGEAASTAERRGWATSVVHSLRELLEALAELPPDACLVDALLPGVLEELGRGHLRSGRCPVVLAAGPEEREAALRALGTGAFDVVSKPVDPRELAGALARIESLHRARARAERGLAAERRRAEAILAGPSPTAARLRSDIQRVAATPRTTVLVEGEPGARKGALAFGVHARSDRAHGPFVRLAGAETSSARLEEALDEAVGGTLVIERIEELPREAQDALADALEERAGDTPVDARADVRICATTERDLDALAASGALREDLAYRLNVLVLHVPPLRERAADVPAIAGVLLSTPELVPGGRAPSEALGRTLGERPWPGNLRELEAALAWAAARAPAGPLDPAHLPAAPGSSDGGGPTAPPPAERSLAAQERRLVLRVLEEEEGNVSRAARVLGINRTTLYNKLRRYRDG